MRFGGTTLITWAGVALLLAGVLVPAFRGPAAALIAGGWAVLLARHRPEAVAWAAVLPLAVVQLWPQILGADGPLGAAACTDPLSPIVVRRLLVAGVGLSLVAALSRVHRSSRAELGLLTPSRRDTAVAAAACAAVAIGGLFIGPLLARPFFGTLEFAVPAGVLVPAVVFGVANGVLEEVQYRGSMQAWLGRLTPPSAAILAQGAVFGVVHAGPEVVSLLPVHIALLASAGIAAGLLRRWSGSLWLPISVHVGADVALYVGLACRAVA